MTYKVNMTASARRAFHRLPMDLATAIAAQIQGPIAEAPIASSTPSTRPRPR